MISLSSVASLEGEIISPTPSAPHPHPQSETKFNRCYKLTLQCWKNNQCFPARKGSVHFQLYLLCWLNGRRLRLVGLLGRGRQLCWFPQLLFIPWFTSLAIWLDRTTSHTLFSERGLPGARVWWYHLEPCPDEGMWFHTSPGGMNSSPNNV